MVSAKIIPLSATTHPYHSNQYWAMLLPSGQQAEVKKHVDYLQTQTPLRFTQSQIVPNVSLNHDMWVVEVDPRLFEERVREWALPPNQVHHVTLSLANRLMEVFSLKKPSLFSVHNDMNVANNPFNSLPKFTQAAKKALISMYQDDPTLHVPSEPAQSGDEETQEEVYA